MKSLLLVILSIFMLAGCGVNNQGESIGTMEEPSRNENNREDGPRDNTTDGMADDESPTKSNDRGENNTNED